MTRDTSKIAFYKGEEDGSHLSLQKKILECLTRNGRSMTGPEIFEFMKKTWGYTDKARIDSWVTPRMQELVRKGKVREDGEKTTEDGSTCILWCLYDGAPRKPKITRPQIGLALFNEAIAEAEKDESEATLFDEKKLTVVAALKKLKERCRSFRVIANDPEGGVEPPRVPEAT